MNIQKRLDNTFDCAICAIYDPNDPRNGNYLPPVEMLQILSKFFDVSINEILNGERINDSDYKNVSEQNVRSALRFFSLRNSAKNLPIFCISIMNISLCPVSLLLH